MFKRWASRFMIIAMVAVILSSCTKKETERTVIKVGDITVSNQLFEKIKGRRYNSFKTKKMLPRKSRIQFYSDSRQRTRVMKIR